MGGIQNVWAPYLTMRHFLLESFVWEAANRVPFLIRDFSYDRDLSQSREDEQQNLAVWATISSRYSLDTIYTYKLRIFNNGCFRV